MKDTPVVDLRRLEIDATPDPAFVSRSLAAITVNVQDARRRDASFLGRLRRLVSSATGAVHPNAEALHALRIPLLVLLTLAILYATLVVAGSLLRRPSISGGNGPAVAVVDGELSAIDMTNGSLRDLLPPGTEAKGSSRSPDGMLVTFWTEGASRLEVVRIDGTGHRLLATAMTVKGARCFDVWSADSRELAAEVLDADGIQRILVVDVATGDARFLTEPSLRAGCPLWSPDGRSIALAYLPPTGLRGIGIIGADGMGFHDIGGSLRRTVGVRNEQLVAGWGVGLLRCDWQRRPPLSRQRRQSVQPAVDGPPPVGVRPGTLARWDTGVVHRRARPHVRPLRGTG